MRSIIKKVAAPLIIAVVTFTVFFASLFSEAPVSAESDETVYYLLTDHLGSVDVVLDEDGNVVERRDYLPYGSARAEVKGPGAPDTDQGFTGKELDDETGLQYYGARYYDPSIGRFVSVDPLVLDEPVSSGRRLVDVLNNPQLLNAYSYAANNPVNNIDPTGEERQKALVTAVIAGLAVTYQYAERAGNGLGFMYETYVTEDYEQALAYARAYDENSADLANISYLAAKKIANDVIPFSGTLLGTVVDEDAFMEDFSLEETLLEPKGDDSRQTVNDKPIEDQPSNSPEPPKADNSDNLSNKPIQDEE